MCAGCVTRFTVQPVMKAGLHVGSIGASPTTSDGSLSINLMKKKTKKKTKGY